MKQDILNMLYEDIGFEDITTKALIPEDIQVKGRIICKENGVVAGLGLVSTILDEFSIKNTLNKGDGENAVSGDVIMELEGDGRTVITIERTVLNLLMKLSGIATLTSELIGKVRKVNSNVIVAGTRKTTPGLQFFEKDAIRAGGGDTHRYRLDDCVLIKDNHLAVVGDVEKAVKLAKSYVSFTKKIEVEVENRKDALKAAKAGADIVMLDNRSPDEIKAILSALEGEGLRDKILIEVSGGINPDNIVEYAKTGVDVISTGFITHSAPALDISLEII
jgi:nicotinate-nucleotide pyrophosphorylase (carboxylating)